MQPVVKHAAFFQTFSTFSLDFLNLIDIYVYKGKMKMENKELIDEIDSLELVDRMLNLIDKFEIAIIAVGLLGIIAIITL